MNAQQQFEALAGMSSDAKTVGERPPQILYPSRFSRQPEPTWTWQSCIWLFTTLLAAAVGFMFGLDYDRAREREASGASRADYATIINATLELNARALEAEIEAKTKELLDVREMQNQNVAK